MNDSDLPGRLETPADSLPRKERRQWDAVVRVGRFAMTTQLGQVAHDDGESPDRLYELKLADMCHASAVQHYGRLVGGSKNLPGRCLYRAWRIDQPAEHRDMLRFFDRINLPLARVAAMEDVAEGMIASGARVFVVAHWFTEPIDGPAAKAALN